MVLASKFLCILVVAAAFLFLYYTLFGISPWDVPDESRALQRFDGGAREVGEIRMSSGEDNAGDDMAARMLTRLRFLLGVKITRRARETHSPAPAPSFFAGKPHQFHFSRPHRHPASPVHRHIAPEQSLEYGSGNGAKKRHKRVVVIVAVLVGAAGVVVLSGTAIFLLCKSSRRRNSKKRSERLVSISRRGPILCAPSGRADNVSFDPTSDQFYLNSLAKYLENDFNMKNAAPGETIPNCQSPKNGHQDDDDDSFHSVSSQPLNQSALSSLEENFSPVSSYKSTSPVRNPTSRTLVTPQKVSTPTQSFLSSSSQSFSGRRFQAPSSLSQEDNVSPLMAEIASSCPFSMEVNVSPLMAERAASSYFSMEDNASPIMTERASSSTARSTSDSNEAVVFSPMSGISNGHSSKKPPPPPPPPPPIRPILLPRSSSARPPPPPAPPCPILLSKPVGNDGTPLPKLKPLHWDKVRAAPDRLMVWDKIRSSSFEFDEKMIESLFGYNLQSSAKKPEEGKSKTPSPGKHVLEHKRLQNVTILMKALNSTAEQVCNALMIGEGLTAQQLEALVKMAPTQEEEEELSKFDGNLDELDPSEKFLKTMLRIPFAFPRSEVMLFKETFEDEVAHLRSSFAMIKEACKEFRSSRLFFRLLEAVLKTGNRMNVGTIRGGARAFKLDALLKLADVKGTDGKTTLLHFVVQEIVRLEGLNVNEMEINNTKWTAEERDDDYKGTCLKLVSGLSTELTNVKKTATIDLDVLVTSVTNLSIGLCQLKHLVEKDKIVSERSNKFVLTMKLFLSDAERIIEELKGDEKQVLLQVRGITEYYHGDVSKDESNPLRIFVIVRDFLCMLDRVCKDVGSSRIRHGPIQLLPFDRRS
ncbi:formin-like protein 11 [Zingiber officinale]|uniref:Formin-like protein n=1 Tax=Zingiber officinale TaxID=94328 RepID=A0A8J5KRK2_ZINOF|nr:formin-like protein 11 [Zingiber officinale]KAG6489527.1 hypothetical protein ZIOFF_050801 [Zingiber officinale]